MILGVLLLSVLSAVAYDFEVDGLYYYISYTSDLTCVVTRGNKKYAGDIKIPATVNYKNKELSVVEIGPNAFHGCTGLTSVAIPGSVTSIREYAFRGCTGLTSVTIPNSVTEISYNVFEGCTALTSVLIPSSVNYIGCQAFRGCSSLEEVTFEYSTSILEFGWFVPKYDRVYETFEDCNVLSKISIGRQLKIEDYRGNKKEVYDYLSDVMPIKQIAYLSILDGVNLENFFYYNAELKNNLTTLNLGKNIIGFGIYGSSELKVSLEEYSKLETIICEDPIPTPDCPKFSASQYANIKVYIPKGSLAAYQNAEGWKNFWDIIEMEESGIDSVTNDLERTEVGRYDLQGRKVAGDYNGIVIVKYSDGTAKKIINRNGNAK